MNEKIPNDSPYRVVGRVKDAHGLKGEIWVVLFAGQADWLQDLKDAGVFFLSETETLPMEDFESRLTEYPLKGAKAHKNGIILQSPKNADRTAAEKLKGRFLAIPNEFLTSEEGDSYFLDEIEGFKVFDGGKELGSIVGFTSNVAQDLLIVELIKGARPGVKGDERIEIPFVDAFVEEVDDEKETLKMHLPAGMVEVQLGLDNEEEPDDAEGIGDDESDETDEDLFDDESD